jgi:hypothetical protein
MRDFRLLRLTTLLVWDVTKSPQGRLEATRDAAVALLEDVRHLRTVLGRQEPSRGEVRRISSVMRRLLIEQDVLRVAAPRVGRVLIDKPDNDPWYALAERYSYFFFISGASQHMARRIVRCRRSMYLMEWQSQSI